MAAAFGDNQAESALRAAAPLNLSEVQLTALRELGECLNYNAYGDSVEDLHFHPAELYRQLHGYADPFRFISEAPAFATLKRGYSADMGMVHALVPPWVYPGGTVYLLPDLPWARRVSGVFGNHLAQREASLAHAVLTHKPDGGYVVSVRAPLDNPSGADELCRQFDSGGGRKSAAGINHLPESDVERFLALFNSAFTWREAILSELISPYGGELVNLMAEGARRDALLQEAATLPSLTLNPRQLCDLELLLNGALSPLRGYMGRADYQGVVTDMRLADGTFWPMPIVLDVTEALAPGSRVVLRDSSGNALAVLTVSESWPADKALEARQVYSTCWRNISPPTKQAWFCLHWICANALTMAARTSRPGPLYPEVVAELHKLRPVRMQRGFTVFFTGLSSAGKTTLSQALNLSAGSEGTLRQGARRPHP